MKGVSLEMMKAGVMAKLMDCLSAIDLAETMDEMMVSLMGC